MADDEVDITRAFIEGTAIDAALKRAVRRALRDHKRLGHSIVVWEGGKLVIMPPEDIPDYEGDEDLDACHPPLAD